MGQGGITNNYTKRKRILQKISLKIYQKVFLFEKLV
jgi:hypothetical protein